MVLVAFVFAFIFTLIIGSIQLAIRTYERNKVQEEVNQILEEYRSFVETYKYEKSKISINPENITRIEAMINQIKEKLDAKLEELHLLNNPKEGKFQKFWDFLTGKKPAPKPIQKVIDDDPVLRKLDDELQDMIGSFYPHLKKIQKEDPKMFKYLQDNGFIGPEFK